MMSDSQQAFIILNTLIAGIFLYHAFQIRRMASAGSLIPYTGVAPMSTAAGLYYLSFSIYSLLHDPLPIRSNAHFVWFLGTLTLYFHILALQSYLELRSVWLTWVKRIIALQAVLTVLSAVALIFFDRFWMFLPDPSHPLTVFPAHVTEVLSPGPMAKAFAASLVMIEVVTFSYFLWKLLNRSGDRLLMLGLILSLAAVVNDLLISIKLFQNGISILFIANFVEILRLTFLIERANRDQLQKVEQSVRLAQIGELTATFVHELKTPLSVVIGSSELGLRSFSSKHQGTPIDTEKLFERIRVAGKKMLEIGETIRRHAYSPQVQQTSFDPEAAIREAVQMLRIPYELESIQLSSEVAAPLPQVYGDSGRFQQVLFNLLQNAKDATETCQTRKIRVTATPLNGHVQIQITDNGCGIPSEIIDKIFSPFFTTKPRGKGTGIGLSFVASQIKAMGGEISVTSQPGQGTTFNIILKTVT